MEKIDLHFPLLSTGERVWRTYIGGKKIDKMYGKENPSDGHFPELWILSTVSANNEKSNKEGLCKVEVGGKKVSLLDLIKEYPNEMLGKKYNDKTKGQMGVLVKLIDSKERLTIQAHPTKENARKYFNSDYGKTECWHIIDIREDGEDEPCIYMGFKENVTRDMFVKCFEEQNLEKMLSLLHKIKVKKGETYIVPGGLPHAIGPGCMLVEIQEPTDFTLRVEKTTPAGYKIDDFLCHQGIGFENMFNCFSYDPRSMEDIINLCRLSQKVTKINDNKIINLVDYSTTDCFKMDKIVINSSMNFKAEDSFYGIYVLSGKGKLISDRGEENIENNNQYFISAICKDFKITAKDNVIELIKFNGQQLGDISF